MEKISFGEWLSYANDDITRTIDNIESEMFGVENVQMSIEDENTLNEFISNAINSLEYARDYIQEKFEKN